MALHIVVCGACLWVAYSAGVPLELAVSLADPVPLVVVDESCFCEPVEVPSVVEFCWLELPVSALSLVELLDEMSLPVWAEPLVVPSPCELSVLPLVVPLVAVLESMELVAVLFVAVEELASESLCVLASVEVVLCVKMGLGRVPRPSPAVASMMAPLTKARLRAAMIMEATITLRWVPARCAAARACSFVGATRALRALV